MRNLFAALAGMVFLVVIPSAWAVEGHAEHLARFSDLYPYWINFFIYLFVIYFLFREPVAKAWSTRRANIRQTLDKTANELRELEEAIGEARDKLSGADREIAFLVSEINKGAESEGAQLVEDAQRNAQRIGAQTRDLIRAERRTLEGAIRRELAERIIQLARERLVGQIDVNSDRQRRASAVSEVGRLIQ